MCVCPVTYKMIWSLNDMGWLPLSILDALVHVHMPCFHSSNTAVGFWPTVSLTANMQEDIGDDYWFAIVNYLSYIIVIVIELSTYDRSCFFYYIFSVIDILVYHGISWSFIVFHDISKFWYYHSLTRPSKTLHPEGYSLNATECKNKQDVIFLEHRMWWMWDQQTVPLNTKDAEQIHQAEVITRSEDLVRFSATWDHLTDGDITHRNPTRTGTIPTPTAIFLGPSPPTEKAAKPYAITGHRSKWR